ncbi:DinB family protein [Paenibacillus sediminis]|uniref:Damage-inducible protein DinB n=1 Tax=Paenibacillus sediminis TaxID=664909 RepID=A0ABS4H517_9BACL|nr:putative damage-inducible protein DinB [Paenibacillus sediminis]
MEETQKAREQIWQSVSDLSDQQLNEHVEAGKWSIMQVLEHLYLTEQTVLKGISNALESEENNPTEPKPVHLVVDRTRKLEAPAHLVPSDTFTTLQEIKSKLDQSREALTTLVAGISEDDLKQKSFQHRNLGLLNVEQWISFIGYHEGRHLAQIEEYKEKLKQ